MSCKNLAQPNLFVDINTLDDIDECRWVDNPLKLVFRPCKFKVDSYIKTDEYTIKILPADSHLKTLVYYDTFKNNQWFTKKLPEDDVNGGIWFGTLNLHNFLPCKNLLLGYKTIKPMYLVFIYNLARKYNTKGFGFVQGIYQQLKEKIYRNEGIEIAGYIGCNECEIFIENEFIKTQFKPPSATHPGFKFLDTRYID